jgi:hypothetical protein
MKRCDFGCCSRQKNPVHVACAKTIHSYEGKNAGPTPMSQLDNAVIQIIVHLGDRKDETNKPGID